MRQYTFKEWQRRKCEKLGHDWAFQDEDLFIAKVCLRCGATQFFFPEEVDEVHANLDDDNPDGE